MTAPKRIPRAQFRNPNPPNVLPYNAIGYPPTPPVTTSPAGLRLPSTSIVHDCGTVPTASMPWDTVTVFCFPSPIEVHGPLTRTASISHQCTLRLQHAIHVGMASIGAYVYHLLRSMEQATCVHLAARVSIWPRNAGPSLRTRSRARRGPQQSHPGRPDPESKENRALSCRSRIHAMDIAGACRRRHGPGVGRLEIGLG